MFRLPTATAAAGILLMQLTACGPKPEPTPPPTPTPSSAEAAAEPSPSIPPPEVTPTPPPKMLTVVTEFRAVSQLGTHEFPVGTQVQFLEEDGEDVLVQLGDVAVKINRSYFSEDAIEPVASPPTATPPPAAPTPDQIAIDEPVPEPAPGEAAAVATPSPTPLGPEEQRISELTDSIRALDNEIRTAPSPASPQVQQLRQKRDKLSEELTTLGKP